MPVVKGKQLTGPRHKNHQRLGTGLNLWTSAWPGTEAGTGPSVASDLNAERKRNPLTEIHSWFQLAESRNQFRGRQQANWLGALWFPWIIYKRYSSSYFCYFSCGLYRWIHGRPSFTSFLNSLFFSLARRNVCAAQDNLLREHKYIK